MQLRGSDTGGLGPNYGCVSQRLYLQSGQVDGVLGTVLQGSKPGDLLQMLLAGLALRNHIEQGLQVVWQHLGQRQEGLFSIRHMSQGFVEICQSCKSHETTFTRIMSCETRFYDNYGLCASHHETPAISNFRNIYPGSFCEKTVMETWLVTSESNKM